MTRDLDAIDRRILAELQRNGRLTHQELSERVGLSPSPCARRVRILEEDNYITGFAALVDEAKVGFGFSVFVQVKLCRQTDDQLVSFEKAVTAYPEVVDCWLMTGNRDYMLRVAVADLAEFERFLTGRLTRLAQVDSLESSIPIRRVKGLQTRLI